MRSLFTGAPRLGVALVGLGTYATDHLGPALRQTRRCRLAAVVSGNADKARRWARKYKLPAHGIYTYDTLDALAHNPDVAIVYVATPPGLHEEQVIRAAQAGKHVICEKPMATSVEACEAMITACRTAGVQLAIGYRLTFHPLYQELQRLARERTFGRFQVMEGWFGHVDRRKTWRHTRELAGGGPLMDLGIYIIQAACLAAGEAAPVAVTACEPPKTRPAVFDEVEEAMVFTLEFADGAMVRGTCSNAETFNRFRAEGPGGWIEINPAFSYARLRARTSRGKLPRSRINQQAALLDEFAACVQDDRPCTVSGEIGRRDLRIMEAIYEAARTGQRVLV